jgi:hypothetical protein
MNDSPATTLSIVPARSDRELADELRAKAQAAIAKIIDVMDEANAVGLRVDFQLGRDGLGRMNIQALTIVKLL